MADNTAYQDLLKDTSESKEDGNYFLVTITDLNPNTTYPIEFRWTYKDKRINDNWSAVKLITTPGESQPNTPHFTDSNVNVDEPEKLIITWDGTSDDNAALVNFDRIDVYIDGYPFDASKPAYSFKTAGTYPIAAPAGTYKIALYAVSKTNKISPVSHSVEKTVPASSIPIQTPTLPSGLSVATAPFAVAVNWNGSYSSSTFTGFKSIDIYAVGSDLGSSVTSGITTTNLVGSLTVNDTTNRINIGLDNLRQALGLTNNSDVYSATIFYYYNATNSKNEKYGSPTYTRINSSSVVPTKANYIDLASGVVSIEHLEAGNGNFASWLRAGSSGGARIELSAVSDFTNSGYTVQKGLVAYSSGNTEIFNLDLDAATLTINGSGRFTGDLEAGSGSSIFKSDSNGIYLGSSTWAGAQSKFRVSRNGVLDAAAGTIGGWNLATTYLSNSADTFRLQSVAGAGKYNLTGLVVGSTSSPYFTIEPTAITHRNADGTASGKFTLDITNSQLTISGNITVTGGNAATTTDLAGKVSNGQVSSDSSFTANNIVYKINGNTNTTTIDGGKITTGTVVAGSVVAGWVYAGNISANQINAGTLSGNYITGGTITGSTIQTSSGTEAVSLDSSYNAVRFKNAGSYVGAIVPWSSNGIFMHYGSTPDPNSTNPRVYVGPSTSVIAGSSTNSIASGSTSNSISGTTYAYDSVHIVNSYLYVDYASSASTTAATNCYISSTGQILKTSTTSSIRYKENIVDINSVPELDPKLLLQIPVKAFKYINGHIPSTDYRANKLLPGLIAEDVDAIYPIAADYDNGIVETWNERFIVPGLLKLVQDLYKEIDILKSRLDAIGA